MLWSQFDKPACKARSQIIIDRLAYHIFCRTRDRKVERAVRLAAKVTPKTLRRYSNYNEPDAGSDVQNGPRRLDVFLTICHAMGDDPWKVICGAYNSVSYEHMAALIASDDLMGSHAMFSANLPWSAQLSKPTGPAALDPPCKGGDPNTAAG